MMTKLRARLRALARGGLLLALLALGVSLVVSAARNYHATEAISALLDRGQAERFFRSIPELHERNRGAASSAELGELLNRYRDEGLRYLVEYDAQGELLAEAGEHVGAERPLPSEEAARLVVVGERVRVTFRPPRGEPHREPPPPPPEHEDFEGRPPPPPRQARLPDLVLEFEPTVANQLRERASKNFLFSTAAALSLVALTLALWLLLLREERRRERSERERHLAALGEMSAVLAHEIRNPLASLKGNAQLLAEQVDASSPLFKKVSRVVSEAKRLEDLTSTLLDLVRSSSVSPQPVDVSKLVRDAADPGRIDVDVSQAPPTFPLDALRMEQVLKNLLQNALQASPEGERVQVVVAKQDAGLSISVRDHGAGFAPGSAEQLFEPFHTTRAQGTGLGLTVARRIVELHGGRIKAENHAQGGAVFTISLPG